MERLVLGSCGVYDVGEIKRFLTRGLQETGFEVKNARVLLKPNVLSGKQPEKAVTTHPAVIQAVGELLLDRGCEVFVGDSPGYGTTDKVLKHSGIMDVIKSTGLKSTFFEGRIIKKCDGLSPYREFIFGEDPDHYDVIINLPKLKSHAMMGLTLGVKNTFGFIPLKEKARWHLRAGKDRLLFASVLIDIHNIVKPSLTILDGIWGMDKDGPTSGRPRPFNLLALSRDAYVLDRGIEELIGLKAPLPISQVAEKYELLREHETVYVGSPVIEDFVMARTMDTDWPLPDLLKRLLKSLFVRKPVLKHEACKGCGVCKDACPPGAIVMKESRPVFDYKVCIRCYCCQEMCPEGAIEV